MLKKETILEEGQLILLELAPVDPRSLMQGDYMRLNYAIARNSTKDSISKHGYCVVVLDSIGIGRKVRLQNKLTPLDDKELLIEYTSTKWSFNIGAESFFFEEGQADTFAIAKYGGLRVDEEGNSILVGLWDKNQQKIGH